MVTVPLRTLIALIFVIAGCEGDDPVVTDAGGDASSPDAGPRDAGRDAGDPDTGLRDAGTDAGAPDAGTPDAGPMCMALATDYTPRTMMSATDTWPACVSDDGTYHPFDPRITTIARVMA